MFGARRAQPVEHDLEATEEARAIEQRIEPASGDAVVRFVRSDVVMIVMLARDQQTTALQPGDQRRGGSPCVPNRARGW